MDVQTNATSGLADHGTVLKGRVDTLNGVVLHADQEARAHLRIRSTGVEERRAGVSEVTLRHEIVCLKDSLDVRAVDTDCDTHEQVLWALSHATVDLQKVGTLQGLEAKADARKSSRIQMVAGMTHKL